MKLAAKITGAVILGIASIFLLGYLVMSLWNWLMPELFGLPTLTYWKAFGLLVLSKLLFGSMRMNFDKWSGEGRWKRKWEAKMANMSPEEQETFKKEFRLRCKSKWGAPEPEASAQ